MIPRSLRRLFRHDDATVNPVGFVVLGVVVSVLPIIFVVLFMIFMTVHEMKNEPKAAQVQADLESEFRAIQPLPEARACGYNASHKSSQSLVSSNYQTTQSYPDIRSHYDVELARHGWTFYEEEQMRDWGRDLGGKSAHYCKAEYRADLQYAGPSASYGWDFAFSVSWGLHAILEKHSDTFRKAGCR